MKDVYVIIEGKEGKDIWQKVGTAFDNRDGSLNVYLNCLPTTGKLHIREHSSNGSKESKEEK